MSQIKKIVFLILLCFCTQITQAQDTPKKEDSKAKKDTTEIYTKIRNYSKKNNP